MPSLFRPATSGCSQVYDPKPQHIRGIPLMFYVRPIARQSGVFVDMPKGYELPTCMVDPCCSDVPDVPVQP